MKAISHRNGDRIEYTGKTMKLHGGFFYEFTYLDGLKKGQVGVTQSYPEDKESFHALLLRIQSYEAMNRTLSKVLI
jgi:hypothetical protein